MKAATPAISVVVPLYNKAGHVRRAIESVLAQSWQDFEIVVVDDGSIDGGAAVVRGIDDPRIRLFDQRNAGVSVARNRGVGEARAELIAFLDADDAYRPEFLANIVALRRHYPAAGAYALNYETVGADGRRGLGVSVDVDRLLMDPLHFFRIAKFGSPVFSSSVAVPKRSLEAAGLFPVGVKLGEDLDTWIRICFEMPIAFAQGPGGIYFQDAEERACNINPPPERYVFFDTIDRWLERQPHAPAELVTEIREFKNSFVIVFARFQVRFGDPGAARRALAKCITRDFLLQKWKWWIASFLPQRWQQAMAGARTALRPR